MDDEDKGVNEMGTPGGTQKTIFITESGLYSLILSSKLPQAKVFKRWVTRKAIAIHVDEDDSLKRGLIDSKGRDQQAIFITESGLYSLILSSKLPQAKVFKRWVTSEVLPHSSFPLFLFSSFPHFTFFFEADVTKWQI